MPACDAQKQPNHIDDGVSSRSVQIEKRGGSLHRVLSLRRELLSGLLVHRLSRGDCFGRRSGVSCVVMVMNHIPCVDVSTRDVLGDAVLDLGSLLRSSWRGFRFLSNWPSGASGMAPSRRCRLGHTRCRREVSFMSNSVSEITTRESFAP